MARFDPRTHYLSREIAESYDADRFAGPAGRIFNRLEQRSVGAALRCLERSSLVLDIPCGTGRITDWILARGHRVVGADISGSMIAVARRRLQRYDGNVAYQLADGQGLPFKDATFDCVTSIRFLSHFDGASRGKFLREFARVSARFVIVSYAYSSAWLRLRRRIKYTFHRGTPVRFVVTGQELADEIEGAGLCEARRFWTAPFLSEEVILLLEKAR
ncbi:MAG TPA: class I SAM-dependent methyltransferase [Candidatus Acidoferrales bacterium]|nr:class I SAM-dependent methyltransferase [Candidatus Acidoferrales bacterium]